MARSAIPEIKCYLPGVPRANYMPFPFQIFQSQSAFFIAYEYAGAVRNIYLKDPGEAPVDTWMGQSVGRWEGETFVVDGHRLQRPGVVRSRGQFRQREAEGHRALHADRAGSHPVRGDDRGSGYVHQAVEDQLPAVSPGRAGRAADGIQVRRVRRGVDVRPVAQDPAAAVTVASGRAGRECVRPMPDLKGCLHNA